MQISAYCHISKNKCCVNGKTVLTFDKTLPANWPKQIYIQLSLNYPKFYKMDSLCQIGFLGVELLKKYYPVIEEYGEDEIALLFSNKTASWATDVKFEATIKADESPRPSLFVYTLPNIVLGEIAIRNKWHGESLFTVFPSFNADFLYQYSQILLQEGAKACLGGWLEVTNDEIDAFLFFIEKKGGDSVNLPFSREKLNHCRDLIH